MPRSRPRPPPSGQSGRHPLHQPARLSRWSKAAHFGSLQERRPRSARARTTIFSAASGFRSQPRPIPRPTRFQNRLRGEPLAIAPDHRSAEQSAAIFSYWAHDRGGVQGRQRCHRKGLGRISRRRLGVESRPASARVRSRDIHPRTRQLAEADAPGHAGRADVSQPDAPRARARPPPTRLVFAKWIVDRRSPTAARVAVNRIWQTIFGTGIVATSGRLRHSGRAPSHPELLDWLAVEFMDRGWSNKQLILLDCDVGDLSPKFASDAGNSGARSAQPAIGTGPAVSRRCRGRARSCAGDIGIDERSSRRPQLFPACAAKSFCTEFSRCRFLEGCCAGAGAISPIALCLSHGGACPIRCFGSFDALNGDLAYAPAAFGPTRPSRRLAGLNEPMFVDAARALALRILRDGGHDRSRAARLCLPGSAPAVRPKTDEAERLQRFFVASAAQRNRRWLGIRPRSGDRRRQRRFRQLPPGTSPTDAAAWTLVSRVLLNLDETLTKELNRTLETTTMDMQSHIDAQARTLIARRWFLRDCGVGLGSIALASLLGASRDRRAAGLSATAPAKLANLARALTAALCGQGEAGDSSLPGWSAPSHLDLFDNKPGAHQVCNGQLPPPKGVAEGRTAPRSSIRIPHCSAQNSNSPNTADPAHELSELLPHTASIADDLCFIKSMQTDAVNHAPAPNPDEHRQPAVWPPEPWRVEPLRPGQRIGNPSGLCRAERAPRELAAGRATGARDFCRPFTPASRSDLRAIRSSTCPTQPASITPPNAAPHSTRSEI